MTEEIIKKLLDILPKLILNIIIFIALIIYLVDHLQVFIETLHTILSFIKNYIIDFYLRYKRRKYNKILIEPDYILWQTKAMTLIYSDLINEFRTAHEIDEEALHITRLKLDEMDSDFYYEAFSWKVNELSYPFLSLCPKDNLKYFIDSENTNNYSNLNIKEKRLVNEYKRLIKQTIHFPKRIGYMLDNIDFDKKNGNIVISAHAGTYIQNVLESHILEYELYKCYKKYFRHNKYSLESMSKDKLLKLLPLRKKIHESIKATTGNEYNIISSGAGRNSLLSVQILVLLKNRSESYDCLRIRRSENVSAKAGYIQLIPSGGFEALGSDTSRESQFSNYSVTKVLFRELAEECFGFPDDKSNEKKNPESIYYHKDIRKIIEGLERKEPSVAFEFIGIAESLVGLRPELCFILKIDDDSLTEDIMCNEESNFQINLIDIKLMEQGEFWGNNDLQKFNCTSASLYELARKSKIYPKCTEKD